MSSFQVPPSSSPPTTPGKTPGKANGSFSFMMDHPSTTPAGPPPSVFSTTPAGAPPPSVTFNSSNFGTGKSLFSTKTSIPNGSKSGGSRLFKTSPKSAFGSNRHAAKVSSGRGKNPLFLGAHRPETTESASASEVENDEDDEDDEDVDGEEDDAEGDEEDEEDDDEYDEDEDEDYTQEDADMDAEGEDDEDDYESEVSREPSREASVDAEEEDEDEGTPKGLGKPKGPDLTSSAAQFDWAGLADETKSTASIPRSSKGTKRSRGASSTSLVETIEADLPPAKRRESALPRIAKDFAKSVGTAGLHDPESVIIGTEEVIQRLARRGRAPPMAKDYEKLLTKALDEAPRDLIRLWKTNGSKLEQEDENMNAGIGPSDDSDGTTKASFLAGMLLRLYHPQAASDERALRVSHRRSLSRSTELMRLSGDARTPYPKILLDFLDTDHYSLEQPIKALYNYRPNPTASPKFWDSIVAATARGQLELVQKILYLADFNYAWRPREEGAGRLGYSGTQLDLINKAVERLSELLGQSPALRDGDWEITGSSWILFRRRVEEALHELTTSLGVGQSGPLSLSGPGASNSMPERIYSNLKIIYGVLLGKSAEILSVSLDWLEATIGLTVWWNGEDDAGPVSLKQSRRGGLSRSQYGRVVDVNPGAAYRRRLAYAVDIVTNGPDDESLMVDTNNAVEVGLASIFEENIEGVIGILQSWSLPVTSAVLEIAKWAGWYETPPSDARPEGFDDSDLMVLSYAKPDKGITKDDVILGYSDLLFEKGDLVAGKVVKEGWELAVDVSYRLDDPSAARKRMAWLISRVAVETDARANKVASVCISFGMPEEARKACESFADHVSTTSHKYGTALIYYARAHATKKCKDVLDLLVSMCLVRSAAYPPTAPDASSRGLDPHLGGLISSPQESLRLIANVDLEAANILSEYISGYATLRRFYDLRDQDVAPSSSSGAAILRPKARQRAAAKAVLACVSSAADSIQGGLYDAELTSVIQVDVLLALLAEAGEFLGQQVFGIQQLTTLLRAIEDLQTVHSRIRRQCEDCFRACLDSKFDGAATGNRLDPSELLKKSVSGLTDTSGFSLIGSELTESSGGRNGNDIVAKDDTPRGWDWRERWHRSTTGDAVIRHLRQGIAKEIASLWIDEA